MEFFLPYRLEPLPFKISYREKILLIGSCFSTEIGNKLAELKFDVLQNPNGILYNPLNISAALHSYIENKPFKEENLFALNGLWNSWQHHSVFSGNNKREVLNKINESQAEAHQFLRKAKFLVITLGTAFYYELKSTHQTVANCHKAPASHFLKGLLPAEIIISEILSTIKEIELLNPEVKIIFTVSPVKHVKDGLIENSHSKARLIEAVHSIAEQDKNAYYFPSYELITDVLRDYRFYKDDLVHPNETAINYVFETFCEYLLDEEGKKILDEIKKIIAAANHKPFLKESEAHQKFIQVQLKNILKLEKKYPFIDFEKEKEHFLNV